MPRQFDRRPARTLSRRRLLEAVSAMAATALAAPLSSKIARGQPRFARDPFALGVASGDPVADGFVL
jgi:alkaline phosphatase D